MFDLDARPGSLLTYGNPKTAKGEGYGVLMDVTAAEHFAYQEAQARAHASGRLSAGEAMIVYRALGETGSRGNGGWAAGTDLPTKVAATLLMGELIGGRR